METPGATLCKRRYPELHGHLVFALALSGGWLISAFAVMLGAPPFWFDILNKFMVVRSTVKPREKSREEDSKDREDDAARVAQDGVSDGQNNQASNPPPNNAPQTNSASANASPLPPSFAPHSWRGSVINTTEIPL